MSTTVTTVTFNRFAEIARLLPDETGEIVEETVRRIETRIKIGMAEAKSGAMYGDHQASAPGEMPAVDTSNLVNNIFSGMDGQTEGVVYTNVDYAVHLEYGTENMAARPFMTPAAEAERQTFINDMRDLEARLG